MEQNNKLYEIIKPVRVLKKHTSRLKKGFIILTIILVFFCGVGFITNEKGLDMNLPFDINSFKINNTTTYIYPWDNNSIVPPILNTNLINPSFSAGGFKIGYN